MPRTQQCDRLAAKHRLDQADAFLVAAGVVPHGKQMSKDLTRLLARKDDAHYGMTLVSRADATKMITWARRMTTSARELLES